jgi:hypothetical protein
LAQIDSVISPRAPKFLDLGAKPNLLPEERQLAEKAQLTIEALAFSLSIHARCAR